VHAVADLKPGMICPGIVTNVTNFGAFVDVGVHQDGLVHVSQLSGRFIKDPHEVVKPGDRVQARVLAVDLGKNQISLSLKPEPKPRPPRAPRKAPAAAQSAETPRPPRPPREKPAQPARAATAPPVPGRAPRLAPSVQTKPAKSAPPRPARPAFNNPFAVLANLKPTGKR